MFWGHLWLQVHPQSVSAWRYIYSSRIIYANISYRCSSYYNAIKFNNVRVSELSHDGGFLEELNSVFLTCFGETLECHIHWFSFWSLPYSLVHTSILPRSQMTNNPAHMLLAYLILTSNTNWLYITPRDASCSPWLQLSVNLILFWSRSLVRT